MEKHPSRVKETITLNESEFRDLLSSGFVEGEDTIVQVPDEVFLPVLTQLLND